MYSTSADFVFVVHSENWDFLFICDWDHLFISTRRTLMSEGDTPGMREAWARVSGSIFVSFWRASVERESIVE